MGIIVEMLFPKKCVGCGEMGKYLCGKCKTKIEVLGADYKNKKIEGRIGLFKYHGAIKDLISLLKFELVSDAKEEIGQMIVDELRESYPNIVEYWIKNNFTIIPVPLYPRRQNWRGFNQAKIIADTVAKILNLKVNDKIVLRKINTKHQAISNKIQRINNLKNAFVKINKVPKNIIVFDDVWTTGNTIKNIVKIIPKNRNIWVLTLASGN